MGEVSASLPRHRHRASKSITSPRQPVCNPRPARLRCRTEGQGLLILPSSGGRVVTKKELAKAIAEELGITAVVALQAVQRTFDKITEALVEEGRIELRNFGVFEVKKRRPKKARNPRTGEGVMVPARLVVTFKPGREMQGRVGQLKKVPGGGP